jgi:predicted N-acetyltransferase YhbS
MQGPRGLRPEELPSLRELTGTVFRPRLVDEYPQLFHEENFENLRVCLDGDGRCVSHVGMTTQPASLFGCTIQVGCIGAVGTLPDYRGQGLASRCFDDAVEKARHDGTDILLVSGDRSLYRRRGCLPVGRDTVFTLTREAAAAEPSPLSVTVEPWTDDDLPRAMDAYRREPVRFRRAPEDYRRALDCGVVMNRPTEFLAVRENGAFRGYLLVGRRDGEGTPLRVAEFAGDRRALLAALPEALRRVPDAPEIGWQVSGHDVLFRDLCAAAAGLTGSPASAPGTVKLVNFPQLLERMRPLWDELLGAAAPRFWNSGSTATTNTASASARTSWCWTGTTRPGFFSACRPANKSRPREPRAVSWPTRWRRSCRCPARGTG